MRLHDLLEARAKAVAAMRALADLAERENRDLTEAEERQYTEHKGEIARLDKKIERQRELEAMERAAPAIIARAGDGQFEDRAREFSVTRAIRSALPRDLGGGDVDAGFEREMSQEVAHRAGRTFQGIAVPDQVFHVERRELERRTLLAGSSAADLVPNVHRADLFIDRLRAALVTGRLGATVLDGLVGSPIDIPRQTGSSTAQWVAEDGSLTETDATFDDVVLQPKTVGAMTSYSRRTLLNTSPAVEQIVRNDLSAIIASAIDEKAMLGDGAGNTPTGIVNVSGVGTVTFASPSWAGVLEFIADVETANALMGSLGWALNGYAVRKLRSTTKVAGDAGAGFLMDQPGNIAGYPAAVTSALPGDPTPTPGIVIFGDWSSLLIGYWTGIDILVNPYESTAYAKGRVIVRAMRDLDVQVRQPKSFSVAQDMAV